MRFSLHCFIFCFLAAIEVLAQTGTLKGKIIDRDDRPIASANILSDSLKIGTVSDLDGNFSLTLPAGVNVTIQIKYVGYKQLEQQVFLQPNQSLFLEFNLKREIKVLDQVEIIGADDAIRRQISITKIDPKAAKQIPSAFGDFTSVLATLPGVTSNNELSSTYSVRGGNFDENLVYVNGIPIYRPFLIRAGQQEGLSFINPDLVENIEFSAGGWQPQYGDKLSSVLNVKYKEPSSFSGSVTLSLLGGGVHLEGTNNNKRLNYAVGARHKRSEYLLGTLETEGEYLPRFTDLQTLVNYELGESGRTKLGGLFSYARNRYLTEPENRETTFGTLNQSFRLFVAFDGRDILQYDSYQGGIKLSHKFSNKFNSDFIVSGLLTREREFFDIEGGYRLCDVNTDLTSADFDECVVIRGIGTNFQSGRNTLDATIINIQNQSSYLINNTNQIEFGFIFGHENIDDQLDEFSFIDSANFVTIEEVLINEIEIKSNRLEGYVQHFSTFNIHSVTYGVRLNYWDFNDQLLVSPRLQYAIKPKWQKDIIFKAAVGYYQQPPFYRELRNRSGQLNPQVKAQSSVHTIVGVDYEFLVWGRKFKFLTEAYYKYLYNVNPYDIDNVRIRYHANNQAKAFATGIDFRINGEFIEGTQSWFSLGLLHTKEDLDGDGQDYTRRPTDQFINLGIYFEDHFPNDPSLRMNLSLLYGSGLPFGPPDNDEFRNFFDGEAYRRVDIGFSKIFIIEKTLKLLRISVEILNLLGSDNTISYIWVKDVNNIQFAVPNSLSARFLNIKLIARF